ncbi:Transcriptional regulator, GntR family / Aspartate aminotransferase [Rhodovastum atsumiense]|uniref:PLP-dependent aminotransferase family protein n=1 Tax=Rhodovastum atsumiense TaxID=504468 RepID=A0A5M6IK62_9PROT|nr:PLP-dependent aminotransferase family protein [Rhodovastum atsumiense]KAA5608651.1 PLP-dependent aminotransferase family protein [Rhodovastum atsumiense]CAH2598807.1 Transcriptional regulator, GntR family / Aspartate aminotransferase [Rhodovastum atsumiense]
MNSASFDYTAVLASDAPPPASRWGGFPRYNFVGGHNDPDQIPLAGLAEAAAAALAREGASLATYGLGQGPLGHLGLRTFIARKSASHRGIAATADDVLITTGSMQGIDLVNRLLVQPGDTVIVEEFSFAGAIGKLRKLGATIIPAPLDQHGLDIGKLAEILRDLAARGVRPKYIYTIPTIQNPTGSILPLDRRQALLALARTHGVPVFEDECYADLVWAAAAPPALYALDPGIVIHIGSFSKSLAPALRLGYVIAPWEVLGRLVAGRTDSTGALEQLVVAEYFSRHFDSHVRTLTGALAEKLDTLVDALAREFGTAVEFHRPDGGIFLWLKLSDGIDVRRLVAPAAAAGIAFNPGPEWAVDPEAASGWLRLCFALPSHQDIRDGVAAFARVCAEQTGIPSRQANIVHGPAGGA